MSNIENSIAPLLRQSFSVTFTSIDCLNPEVGIACILEGPFGRVSVDGESHNIAWTLECAMTQYNNLLAGKPSNVRPVLSLAEQVLVLPDSDLEKLRDRITTELDSRRTNYADAYR